MVKLIRVIFSILFHCFIIIALTLTSQIGGIVWLLVFILFSFFFRKTNFLVKFSTFLMIYLGLVFFLVPPLAEHFGRKPLPFLKQGNLIPQNFLYVILNRNYVNVELHDVLTSTSQRLSTQNPDLKIVYLDGSFPFIDGLTIPPHFSHDNGKKIDLCLIFSKNGKIVHSGKSFTGYGGFVDPEPGEYNQTEVCLARGHSQYDFCKYLSFGRYDEFEFDVDGTRLLINELLSNPQTHKIYIEPHLKQRLGFNDGKIRFAGCRTVRHDDHIHYQIY